MHAFRRGLLAACALLFAASPTFAADIHTNPPAKTFRPSPAPAHAAMPMARKPVPLGATLGTVPTLSAYALQHGVGMNTHLGWGGTPYGNLSMVEGVVDKLGIKVLRDSIPQGSANEAAWTDVCKNHGVVFDILATTGGGLDFTTDMPNYLEPWLAGAGAGCAGYIEGPNEFNGSTVAVINGIVPNGNVANTTSAGIQSMQFIQYERNNKAMLKGIQLITPTFLVTDQNMAAEIQSLATSNLGSLGDMVGFHPYTNTQTPTGPLAAVKYGLGYTAIISQTLPAAFTEEGFSTGPTGTTWSTQPDAQSALMFPAYLLDAFSRGVKLVDYYASVDGACSPAASDNEDAFGLADCNGNLKPQGLSVASFLKLVADSAIVASPTPVSATITGSSTLQELGTRYVDTSGGLFLWDESTTATAKVTLPTAMKAVVTDVATGTVKQTLASTTTISLSVGMGPQFIKLTAPAAVVVSNPTPVTTTPVTAPTPTPTPAPVTQAAASPAGTMLTGPTGSLIDSAGNTWTLAASSSLGNQVKLNGALAGYSAQVVKLLWDGKVVSQSNGSGWWSWVSGAWTAATPMQSLTVPVTFPMPANTAAHTLTCSAIPVPAPTTATTCTVN